MCLQFFCLQVQICQVCIISLCGPWAKVAYLHFIYSLCALHVYECNQLYQILITLSTSKIIFLLSTSYIRFISQYQLNQVFNFSISSASISIFISVSILFDSASVFLSSYILAELCSSPCTLHHSRF